MTKKLNALLSILITLAVVLVMGTAASYAAVSVKNGTAKVNSKTGVNLRSSASIPKKNDNIIITLDDNTKLTVKKIIFKSKTSTAKTNKWYYVSAEGKKGYIRADNVDGQKYTAVDAKVTKGVTYRKGAGTKMTKVGTLKKGTKVQVLLKATPVSSTKGSSSTWYMIKYKNKNYYACSSYFKLIEPVNPEPTPTPTPDPEPQPISDDEFKANLEKQGFDSTYVDKLMKLHEAHPNWVFQIKKLNIKWSTALSAETTGKVSQIQRAGSSSWVVANEKEVAYYMDPRNFLNENETDGEVPNVFMFEKVNYCSETQKPAAVEYIIDGSGFDKDHYDFSASLFINAGKACNVSPVHLAARARQETGGKVSGKYSPAITGEPYSPNEKKLEKKTVYNPFNIDANSSVYDGLNYAYENGWFTKEIALIESAKIFSTYYVYNSYPQNTVYFQKFNIPVNTATHQYMSNIKAPYSESITTYKAYKAAGTLDKQFTFIIPVYKSMPKSTSLS